jgi:hypothetical protein
VDGIHEDMILEMSFIYSNASKERGDNISHNSRISEGDSKSTNCFRKSRRRKMDNERGSMTKNICNRSELPSY